MGEYKKHQPAIAIEEQMDNLKVNGWRKKYKVTSSIK